MEPVLYFYSIDGTATFGPVTEDALRQLFKDQLIGPGSFICPQGENEWKPVDLEWLRRAQLQTPRLPRYEPPPYVPTDTAKEREEARAQQLEEKFDEGPLPELFKWGGVALALVVTAGLALMQDGIQNIVAGALAGVLVTGLIPYLVSQSFKPAWKLRAGVITMAVLALLTFTGQEVYNRWMRQDIAMDRVPDMPSVASPAPAAAPAAPAAISSEDVAAMEKTTQPVQQEMIDKVKTSDAAEKACGNFDPASLASQDDLHALQGGIKKLRTAQSDVLAYFQTYDDRCRTSLAGGGFGSDAIERYVAGVHQARRIDQAVAIWQLRIKLTDDHLDRLDFLDKHWGNWQPKNGQLLFVNQADLDSYNALTQALAIDIQRGNELQGQVQGK